MRTVRLGLDGMFRLSRSRIGKTRSASRTGGLARPKKQSADVVSHTRRSEEQLLRGLCLLGAATAHDTRAQEARTKQ